MPGGVRAPLADEGRDAHPRARIPEARATALDALGRFKRLLDQYAEEAAGLRQLPDACSWAWWPTTATWEHYDGQLRFVDSAGNVVADRLDPARYDEFIGEAVEPWSYLKSPYYRPLGYPDGIYRVGPLARLNVCTRIGTPLADQELREFRERGSGTVTCVVLLPLRAADRDPGGGRADRAAARRPRPAARRGCAPSAGINQLEGVGVSEAPRGTLFHHYQVDEHGLIQQVNLIIATGQNNLAMNRTVAQIAQHYVHGPQIPEGMLNRVEAGIRAFDPCLSCSTHAAGTMPLHITLVGPDGAVLDEMLR